MAFSADTMAITLALAKKYTNSSITSALSGVKSIAPDATGTKIVVMTADDQVFELDIQQTFTADQVELIGRMSIVNDELAFDGNVIEGLTPEQSALLATLNQHIQDFSNPHKTSVGNLTDVEITSPLNGQVIMLEDGVYKNKTLSLESDGKVKMNEASASKFLEEQVDGITIANTSGSLSALGLVGLNTSISELNFVDGLDEPIMTKFAKFGNGNIEVYATVFATYQALSEFDFSTIVDGTTYLMYVASDETHENNGTIYLCNNETNTSTNPPSYAGLSSATQRNLSVDKVNLETEVKNVLPKANMDLSGLVTDSQLSGYMTKAVYDQNNNGIVDKAETLEGLTKTAQQLNNDIGIDNIIAGTNITLSKNTTDNTVVINSTGGGGGGSSVQKSDINGNIINNGEQMVVYDDSEVQAEIDSLNNRSVIGAKGECGYFMMLSNMTIDMDDNLPIKFEKTIEQNGIALNPSHYSVSLNANVTYKLTLQVQYGGTANSPIFKFFNLTNNKYIGHELYTPVVSSDLTLNSGNINSIIYTPSMDCEITANFLPTDAFPVTIYANRTALTVEEISRTYTLDPVKYAQEHEVVSGSFKLADTVPPNVGDYLKFTDRINGNFEMNEDGTFTLKKDTTYDISIGILAVSSMIQVQLYDITNSRLFGNVMDCIPSNSNYNFNTLPNINTQITPTSDILVGAKVTVSSNTSLLNTDICYFNITEIKNPVVVEYTNLKEISNPLMSSQISQEAPIGTVIEYVGNSVPEHYLACNGQVYNIVNHQELFNKIGNKFGGDGITTFAVPNYSGDKFYIKSEATHYAINQYGGFQMDTLWEGSSASNNATITLSEKYTDYDMIYICCGYNTSFIANSPFPIATFKIGDYLCVDVPSIASTYANNTARVLVVSETTMTLTNSTNVSIYKVVGMKGSIPSVIEGGAL